MSAGGDDRLPVAIDAMGGDNAPAAVVEGALRAVEEGIPVLLVGPPELIGDPRGLPVHPCTEVIDMHEDGARAVRRKKDSSLVVAAELVRDGRAAAMLSAGNTGASVAAALLRMGRLAGVSRPGIAVPVPVPGSTPTVLIDAGANTSVQPPWTVQFARMGSAYARARWGIDKPRVGLLNIGEEPSKGTDFHREAFALLREATGIHFIGNIEGRDLISDRVDVAVTDGFTGNVALKALEGSMHFVRDNVFALLDSTPEVRQAAQVVLPLLRPLIEALDVDNYGGAMTLGLKGMCVISHGSSSPWAILNGIRAAAELMANDVMGQVRAALAEGA